ncbi:protein bicaudal C homolog 1-like isoform X2 [Palaemon carinicauda]|uniref:protein bicaudal C homolog 1-like isoform X2 n=1 Tax=Palaemon carinicauda TaxID=392227 RepID=UPI0035B642EA
MGPHNQRSGSTLSEDSQSEGTLSRANSCEKMTPTTLSEDGLAEQKFRVDRRKLEAMILGCPADPRDVEFMRLPIRMDGRILSAEDFFQRIMEKTKTDIKYPKFLKVGARNKKDPHVRVVGEPEAVRIAGAMVRQELEPLSKVTMKLDVSWVHHSFIIGKGGITIQPIVRRTGVSIHFPDGNKNSEVSKSNQVSVNSRGEDLSGLEEARASIRELTPIVFTFTLSARAQFINITDPSLLMQHVQTTYNVQADLRVTDDISPLIVGSVRGNNEFDAVRVKEATLCILQAYCDKLAKQMPVQMTLEISPQHHSFVLGKNNETLKRIMQLTATKITFPDASDLSTPPLKRSTVTISGSVDNVYLARQNLLGCLPLVLMFELMPDQDVDPNELRQIMQTWDVNIFLKNKKLDGRRLVVIKGAEKHADNIYEAWRLISRAEKEPPKARIPSSYIIPEADPLYGIGNLNIGQWLSGSESPNTLLSHSQGQSSTRWDGGLPLANNQAPSYLPRSPYTPLVLDSGSSLYANNCLPLSGNLENFNCLVPKTSGGGNTSGLNINSVIPSVTVASMGDASCGNRATSTSTVSSDSSPVQSPRDASPDQLMTSQGSLLFGDFDSSKIALSVMMTDIERRAPGCEKKRLELEHQKLNPFTDYSSKKLQAARAMKEQVHSAGPRTPTSNWSGYGFSKSMPDYMIRQKMQERWLQNNAQKELEKWDGWQAPSGEILNFSSSQGLHDLSYSSQLSQIPENVRTTETGLTLQRPPVNFSASNIMDCILPRSNKANTTGQLDITSILTDIQLEQYIDVFAAQDVDLNMFMTLDSTDLKELGIKIFGHRKRILMVIKDLASKKPFFGGNSLQSLDHSTTADEGSPA